MMRYGSVCSGVEAFTLAVEPLGWQPVFFSEIDAFPAAVLAKRWPAVPNPGDFTKINGKEYHGAIDLLVGGTPCQGFSIAGERGGMDDPRSGLAREYCKLAYECGSRWILWENVPGVFSSDAGRDFAGFLSLLCGWRVEVPAEGWKNAGIISSAPGCFGLAWRVFDAQYVRVEPGFPGAVPQRRRRVFVVGHIGDWRRAAAVLFEPGCMSRDTPPRRKARQEVAGTIGSRTSAGGGFGTDFDLASGIVADVAGTLTNAGKAAGSATCQDAEAGLLVCVSTGQGNAEIGIGIGIGTALNCNHEVPIICAHETGPGYWREDEIAGVVKINGAEPSQVICIDGRQITSHHNHSNPQPGDPCHTLSNDTHAPVIAFSAGAGSKCGSTGAAVELSPTLKAANSGDNRSPAIAWHSTVRRLMPLECERLMGFPDNHTRLPVKIIKHRPTSKNFKKFPDQYQDNGDGTWTRYAPDSPRYKACGNSMCVNVMRHLAQRIDMVEKSILKVN